MRWNGFASSLVFAAVAAAGWSVFALAFAPFLGRGPALGAYALLSVAAYLAGIAESPRQGARGAALALLLGGLALAGGAAARDALLAAAAILGLCRSGLLYRAPFARSLVTEIVLLGSGLALAGAWLGHSVASGALAVWGFYLVQSVFFLLGGRQPRRTEGERDPFEVARTRMLALLEEEGRA